MYEPTLMDLSVRLDPPKGVAVLDQLREGACTGFGLAAVINFLNASRITAGADFLPTQVSPRMLYEMAKLHDEWEGIAYEGSSIRGALKGFFHNGVCSLESAPYEYGGGIWTLTLKQAEEARFVGLGAYYRLRPNINDYHGALNEVGAIYCSARVHRGWQKLDNGEIAKSETHTGGHAFAIVGYDQDGFLIQNSWGEKWGGFRGWPGIAHWNYRDWAANVMDAWVLRLSVPTPKAFDLVTSPLGTQAHGEKTETPPPRRAEIVGHFANIDDAKLVEVGRYASPLESLSRTAEHLRERAEFGPRRHDHIVIYAHGGLNSLDASARRIHAMKEIFKRNRIYPIHFMWGTGFTDEFLDALTGAFWRSTDRVGGFTDFLDKFLEKMARPVGRAVWRQMKVDANRSFLPGGGGYQVLQLFLSMNSELANPYKIHLVGHSAGSILHGYLLDSIPSMGLKGEPIESLHLMAPACTVDLYDNYLKNRIGKDTSPDHVKRATIYRLTDSRERSDNVGKVYQKSLLYFVSNAFEEIKAMPLLGMEVFENMIKPQEGLEVIYAGRKKHPSDSESHGGFDNDRTTMNNVLKTILGAGYDPTHAFQPHELEGY